ncbi:hypothetical protein B1A87_006925 [Arthrobacter sp. KBS0703]|uniref:hypothetical protein n=1 Tax=Arthrobacter sp. KBS0703 TaxID=1955698 RepID=UPI00098FEF1D|nr:hypothetical protein [Arthrobacter sp. KBS0703]TSE15673.1 hypothetical protein B1A87_006925 [Arthrobacter sp. KBS0703]
MRLKRDAAHISVKSTISVTEGLGAMTLEHTELSSLVSEADLAELASLAAAVSDGMDRIKELHPATAGSGPMRSSAVAAGTHWKSPC